jgi:transcriptional regulator with XRE-family HTH domain
MSRTLSSHQHALLRGYIASQRRAAGLTQVDVAKRLGRYQSFVANIETGQRRVDVVELIEIAAAIGFDPKRAIEFLTSGGRASPPQKKSRAR